MPDSPPPLHDLSTVIHMARAFKRPTMSTVEAGRVLGCTRAKVTELLNAGLLAHYRLPKAPRSGRRRPVLDGSHESSADGRHHRIPTICVLLTVLREMRAHFDCAAAANLLGALMPHMPLPLLRALHGTLDQFIAMREHQLKAVAGHLPKAGPRSAAAQALSPLLPLSTNP